MAIDRLLDVIEKKGWLLKNSANRRDLSWEEITEIPKAKEIMIEQDYILVPESKDLRYSNGFGPCLQIDPLWPGIEQYRITGNELHFNRLYVATERFTLALSVSTVFNKNPDTAMLHNSLIDRTFEMFFYTIEPMKYAV